MKIAYRPTGINNFHNQRAIKLVISGEIIDGWDYPMYRISAHQARKIARHFCGVTDCRCPHGAVEQLNENGTEHGIRVECVTDRS